jgi:hypothetical protein
MPRTHGSQEEDKGIVLDGPIPKVCPALRDQVKAKVPINRII